MSVKVTAFIYDLNFSYLGLNPTHKAIALAYADHADHDGGSVFPAIKTISLKTEHARRTVRRATRALERAQLMIADGSRNSGVNRWRFELDELYLYTGGRLGGVSESHPMGASERHGGASESPPRGVATPPDSLTNTSITLKDIVELWVELFPSKPKPSNKTKSYMAKARVRLAEPEFLAGWENALIRAATNKFLQSSNWFTLEFFLRNDLNWQKLRDGVFDFKDRSNGQQRPAADGSTIATDVDTFKANRGATSK